MAIERPAGREQFDVVAGILRDDRGRILLAERPPGKHLAGTWEFPGGKRGEGEAPKQALARELAEELGIEVLAVHPVLSLHHRYPDRDIHLQFYTVDSWRGRPRGLEGQALRWVGETEMNAVEMPAADRPVLRALSLDARYAITPDPSELGGVDDLLDWTRGCLARGIRLLQLRAKSLEEIDLLELAGSFGRLAAEAGARWLFNGPPELAAAAGADGVHLDGGRLAACERRPLPQRFLVSASCHDESELMRAGALGLDFVTLSPVRATLSHPGLETLGWDGFSRLCRRSPLPVYALGGVAPDDLSAARERGSFGVAGIRAFGAR